MEDVRAVLGSVQLALGKAIAARDHQLVPDVWAAGNMIDTLGPEASSRPLLRQARAAIDVALNALAQADDPLKRAHGSVEAYLASC